MAQAGPKERSGNRYQTRLILKKANLKRPQAEKTFPFFREQIQRDRKGKGDRKTGKGVEMIQGYTKKPPAIACRRL